jgi:hypothetical protein
MLDRIEVRGVRRLLNEGHFGLFDLGGGNLGRV